MRFKSDTQNRSCFKEKWGISGLHLNYTSVSYFKMKSQDNFSGNLVNINANGMNRNSKK